MKEWRIEPERWRMMKQDDQAQLIAFEIVMNTIEQYHNEWYETRRKDRKDGKASNPYSSMCKSWGLGEPLANRRK